MELGRMTRVPAVTYSTPDGTQNVDETFRTGCVCTIASSVALAKPGLRGEGD